MAEGAFEVAAGALKGADEPPGAHQIIVAFSSSPKILRELRPSTSTARSFTEKGALSLGFAAPHEAADFKPIALVGAASLEILPSKPNSADLQPQCDLKKGVRSCNPTPWFSWWAVRDSNPEPPD